MSKFIAFLLIVLVAAPAGIVLPATTTQKTSTQKKKRKTTATTAKKSGAKSGTKSGAKSGTAKKGTTKKGQTWRTRQLQPTQERYREIQQALAQKGYLASEPTGVWNQDSIDALRRFQTDQKLEPSGKIDSLSLIALGLGPKHQTAQAVPPQGATHNP